METPEPWVVDEDGRDDVENMARELLAGKGTDREWIAVGINDAEGYAESVAYTHPNNAKLIASAPLLKEQVKLLREALATVAAFPLEDDEGEDAEEEYARRGGAEAEEFLCLCIKEARTVLEATKEI